MTSKLRFSALTVTAFVLLGVTGCGSTYSEPVYEEGSSTEDGGSEQGTEDGGPHVSDRYSATPPDTTVFIQVLPDGREVMCVWATGSRQGGLSCDFENATAPDGE